MARVNVDGTRQVLAAAAAVGAAKVVRVSSATVYGAWPNNPVPLTEAAPLRPNPQFSPAVQGAEVERLLAEWQRGAPRRHRHHAARRAGRRPGRRAPPGRGSCSGGRRCACAGPRMPVQVVHVDDLASRAGARRDARPARASSTSPPTAGSTADAARELLPRSTVPAVSRRTRSSARSAARGSSGVGDVPPGVVPYLVHPWVIANDKLRAAGWAPEHSNAEAIAEAVAPRRPPRHAARRSPAASGRGRGRSRSPPAPSTPRAAARPTLGSTTNRRRPEPTLAESCGSATSRCRRGACGRDERRRGGSSSSSVL